MRKISFHFVTTLLVLLSVYTATMAQSKGFDVSRMNNSVEACTDFFEYANGTWLKNTEIPAAYSRWGSFNVLAENNRDILKSVLDESIKVKGAPGSDMQLIGDYYSSCMDEAGIEKAGITPLEPYFNQIAKIKNVRDLERQIAMMHNMGIPVLFGLGGGPDIKNSSMNIANAGQGGLSLPNREYYLNGDEKSQKTREKFREYMINMFKLLGDSEMDAHSNAQTIFQIQTRLAYASKAPVELRNPDNRYNKISFEEAKQITPNFDWDLYMQTRQISPITEINVGQPDFFKAMNAMLKDISIGQWKTYLRWMLINSAAPILSKKFVDENFNFYSAYLQGTKEQQPRWKRCVTATDGDLGEALGTEYVKKAFTPEAKARMDELITNLFAAMKERISGLDWMSGETKVQAQKKLSTFKRKIGYPDVLRGYKGLAISRDSYLENSMTSNQFQVRRNLEDIGKPVDRTRWGMTPPTVNAYYNG
ncbi:MAG: M13 family metallopeptidase, partial [Pyrinomonadaceae bacterium]